MPLTKVYSVDFINVLSLAGKPHGLTITARGSIMTRDFRNPSLKPRFDSLHPPKEGIYEFDFVADQIDALQYEKLLPVDADYRFFVVPADIEIVRIFSETNVKASLCKPQNQTR